MAIMVATGDLEKKDRVLRWHRRFEGQIRGLQGIFDWDRYRIEVLDQRSATTGPFKRWLWSYSTANSPTARGG
jgi:DNA-binding FrmR family transcriptional regulator